MPDRTRPSLRILHWPTDVGGHPSGLSLAERALGFNSHVAVIARSPFGYHVDLDLGLAGASRFKRLIGRTSMLLHAARDYDIVHLNFAQPFLPTLGSLGIDLPLLKASGVRIFSTCQGCDIRLPEQCAVCAHGQGPCALADSARRRNIAHYIAAWSERVFCLNPDLLHLMPGASFMPYASIDPDTIAPAFLEPHTGPLRIVHAPTHRTIKGTAAVVAAAKALGPRVDLDLVEGLTRTQALERYARADVIIDQLRLGWYGGLSVEAMALGKIVISRVDPALAALVPLELARELPILHADENSLHATIERVLAMSAQERDAFAHRSRRFAERWHRPVSLAHWVGRHYAGEKQIKPFAPGESTNVELDAPPEPGVPGTSLRSG
jgi:hypothetical protein